MTAVHAAQPQKTLVRNLSSGDCTGLMELSGLASVQADVEADDRRKEEEEAELTFTAEDLDRCASDAAFWAPAVPSSAR